MVKTNYPVVFLDRRIPELPITSVLLDNEQAVKMAVEHLVEKGYKNIALMTNAIHRVYPRQERVRVFKELSNVHQLPIDDGYIVSKEIGQLKASLGDLLANKPVDAIIAGNDLALLEILNYVKEHHIEIPKDLALISIDDVSFGNLYNPPLTVIAQPAFEMGKKAAELLLGKINGDLEDEKPIYLFQPVFIERASC
jgi:LacI family kdg operon repressor